jgi:Cu2+-exporting ATPase
VAGLLWFQAMMATMATWPEFNIDLSPELHTILRWVALFLTTPIVFYSCAPFFKGAMRDLRTRHLTMDVSVSLAIGLAYIAGIWTAITGVASCISMPSACSPCSCWPGATWNAAPANARRRPPRNWSTCCRPRACAWTRRPERTHPAQRTACGDRVLVLPGAILPADG